MRYRVVGGLGHRRADGMATSTISILLAGASIAWHAVRRRVNLRAGRCCDGNAWRRACIGKMLYGEIKPVVNSRAAQ